MSSAVRCFSLLTLPNPLSTSSLAPLNSQPSLNLLSHPSRPSINLLSHPDAHSGALTKITRTITDDIGTNKPIHRRQVFRGPASPPATPTATKTHISSSSSDVSSSSVYSAVHSTAATISESDANSAAATVGTSTSASIISSAREATARSSSTGGSGGGGSGGDSSSSVMRRNATSIDNSTPSMLVAVQRFAYSSIWKVGENILYWSDAEGASNDKNFVFDCHNKSVTKSSF